MLGLNALTTYDLSLSMKDHLVSKVFSSSFSLILSSPIEQKLKSFADHLHAVFRNNICWSIIIVPYNRFYGFLKHSVAYVNVKNRL